MNFLIGVHFHSQWLIDVPIEHHHTLENTLNDYFAMVTQQGIPNWFCSFSASVAMQY